MIQSNPMFMRKEYCRKGKHGNGPTNPTNTRPMRKRPPMQVEWLQGRCKGMVLPSELGLKHNC